MAELKVFELGRFFNVLVNACPVNYRLSLWANFVKVGKACVPLMGVCMAIELEDEVIVLSEGPVSTHGSYDCYHFLRNWLGILQQER